ncbi:uncharacterized protein LY89DRAFT_736685 [Mollisia scopiformis]|uniref:HNH nuclease domain-containing protein n=1 Tax=Mollisia scopiformis TaxID=149040 RepID=A0A194X0G2_MOLSC|nr:uncharacterized protein LY89DRAFT_736685 [Mollisia scopiformis]KUJ13680.1 hypothetical protein LY89DRAFT_736685 [Mollisia scopiformis]
MDAPKIPERTSSKRATNASSRGSTSSATLVGFDTLQISDMDSLKRGRKDLEESIKIAKKKLKVKGSFSIEFWTAKKEVADLTHEKNELHRRISIESFEGPRASWEESNAAKELFEEQKAWQLEASLAKKQIDRLTKANVSEKDRIIGRSYVGSFTTSRMGLDIQPPRVPSASKRNAESDIQSTFKTDLIKAYGAAHGEDQYDSTSSHVWCPILKRFFLRGEESTAAHLFAWKHGQQAMDAIFGPMEHPELNSPRNGMLVSTVFENVWDEGFLAIVPAISDEPSPEEVEAWEKSEPKEYKIRILNLEHKLAGKEIEPTLSGDTKKWRELHGEELTFRTEFRPRARYLYFHYCLQILRFSWWEVNEKSNQLAGRAIRGEMNKKFWGTKGRYVPEYMIRAFIEEIGQDWEVEEEHGEETSEAQAETQDALLQAMVDQAAPIFEDDDDDEDEDEDED